MQVAFPPTDIYIYAYTGGKNATWGQNMQCKKRQKKRQKTAKNGKKMQLPKTLIKPW